MAIRNHAQLLERKILEATLEYRDGPWGRATESSEGAAALCEPASLVFMSLLERNGVEAARLFKLSSPRRNSLFGAGDVHFVVVIDEESFDVTARRFEPNGPTIWRRGLILVGMFWDKVEELEVDGRGPSLPNSNGDGVPENWRELADAEPPADGTDWR